MSKELTKAEYKRLSTKLDSLKQKQKKLERVLEPSAIILDDKRKYLIAVYQTISILYSNNTDHTKLIKTLKELAESIESEEN